MLSEFKFVLFLSVLYVPPTLLQTLKPLEASTWKVDLVTKSNDTVTGGTLNDNKGNLTTPQSSIQQIDVKDEQTQVISNVKLVMLNNDTTMSTINNNSVVNQTKGNDTNTTNAVLKNTLNTITNITGTSYKEETLNLTNPKSFQGNETIQQIDVKDEQNQIKTNVKQVNISNDSTNTTSNINTVVKDRNNNTDINNGTKRNTTNNIILNNTPHSETNNLGDQSNHTTDGDAITQQSNILNTTGNISNKAESTIQNANIKDTEISWRLDIPKSKSRNVTNTEINTNLNKASYNKDPHIDNFKETLNTNDENQTFTLEPNNRTDNVFVIINSGNIEGFAVNSAVAGSNLTADTSTINTNNKTEHNPKIINDLINTKENSVVPNLLKPNIKNFNTKNTFWIFNSGNILNFRLNSPVLEDPKKYTISKDRSKRNSNNNTKNPENSGNLETPIIDFKFRMDENSNKNKYTPTSFVPTKMDNSSYELNNTRKTLSDSITNETTKSDQDLYPVASPNDSNLSGINKVLQPLSQLKQVGLDINNLDIVGNTIDFIKRFKRDTDNKQIHWKKYHKIPLDDVESDKKIYDLCISNKNCLSKDRLLKSSYGANNENVNPESKMLTFINNFVDIKCPISFIVNLGSQKILKTLSESKNVVIATIYPTINSLLEDDQNPINLLTLELLKSPFPITIRVQLLHGNTKDFINELSNYIDTNICQLMKV